MSFAKYMSYFILAVFISAIIAVPIVIESKSVLKAACNKKITIACVRLGEKLASKDLLKALMLFKFACDYGDKEGCNKTRKYKSVYKKMRRDMKRACKSGDGLACDLLKRERRKMKETYKDACEAGNEKACEKYARLSKIH